MSFKILTRCLPVAAFLACLLMQVRNAEAQPAPAISFRDVTADAGLVEALAGMMGHGGAWGDYDGDGWIDLYVGGFCDRPDATYKPAAGPVPNRLYRNLGNGKFALAKQPAAEFYGRTSGAVFADLDNDGFLDLYVANNGKAKTKLTQEPQKSAQTRLAMLFHNDKGKLLDVSQASGACLPNLYTARNIGILDYDGDGLLDLLVIEDKFTAKPRSALLRNKGKMQFEDVTAKVGLPDNLFGLGLAIADLNGDHRPDFFVPHSNRMFLSTKGATYTEPAELKEYFAWKPLHGEDWPCGAAFGDLNRDGRLDLVLTIHGVPARNKIYLNEGLKNGVPQFREVSQGAGFGTPVPVRCPHVEIQDFDNDGWPDIYTSAGWLDQDKSVTPLIFRNLGVKDGAPQFQPPRPIKAPMIYFPAGPSGDYDKDGRLDLFLINWFEDNHCRLLHNECAKKHWLDVQVVGKTVNRMGIGAVVQVYATGKLGDPAALLGVQEIATGYGYASGQPAICHFGLGDVASVDVRVTLPNGKSLMRKGVTADQRLKLEE